MLKHCVAKVVHELADPLVASVLRALEARAALAIDETRDDALRQGKSVVRAEIQLIFRRCSLNYNSSRCRSRTRDCQPKVVTTIVTLLTPCQCSTRTLPEGFQWAGRPSRHLA